MMRYPVYAGAVGASVSFTVTHVLLQVDDHQDGASQSRAVLTAGEAVTLARELLEEAEKVFRKEKEGGG